MSASDEPEDFASLLAEQGRIDAVKLRVGDAVRATVVHISKESVFCSVSRSQEGWISAVELTDAEGQLTCKIGDVLDAYVVALGDSMQLAQRVSIRGGGGRADTALLEGAQRGGLPVDGTVTGVNKGGLEVTVAGTRGFCPIGQADIEYVEDAQTFVGKTLQFLVTQVKEGGRNVVLSRRALLQREREVKAAAVLETLREGQRVHGKVTRLADFGAFVDLGGIEGLVPMSELAHHRVGSVSEVLSAGQEVDVEVRRVEDDPKHKGKKRISLSLKATLADPFDGFAALSPVGQLFEGQVVRLETFGAFVRLAAGVEGLVHVSEVADKRIRHPSDVVQVGQTVTVRVVNLDNERKRIGLSLRQAKSDGSSADAAAPGEERDDGSADRAAIAAYTAASVGGLGTLGERLAAKGKKRK